MGNDAASRPHSCGDTEVARWRVEPVAPSTTRSYHRVLSIMLEYPVREGRLTRIPANGVRLPRVASRKHGYLTYVQVHQFAELCGPDSDVFMFSPMQVSRWGEMAAVRVMISTCCGAG